MKKRLKLINENLHLIQDSTKEKARTPEIKSLFKNIRKVFEEVQKKYVEVGNKTKSIVNEKEDDEKFNDNIFDIDIEEEKTPLEKEKEV